MKKFTVWLAAGWLAAGSTWAAGTVSDNCGCGLGRMALGDKEATVLSQLAATFLNGICGNQTFGITSGTLDCAPPTGVVMNERVQQYVEANLDNLAVDIAQGEGAALDALADLMAVSATDRGVLYARLQKNFDSIFASSSVSSTEVVKNLEKVVNG